LEKTPSDRPANADELITLLDQALVEIGTPSARRALPEEPLSLARPRFSWLVVALPLLVIGVLAVAWLSARQDQGAGKAELPGDRAAMQDSPVTALTGANEVDRARPAERTNGRGAARSQPLGESGPEDDASRKQKPTGPPPPPLLPKRRDERYGRFE
jgi:hypothetical protein